MFKKALLGGVALAAISATSAFAGYDVNSRVDALENELRELKAQMQMRDQKMDELETATAGLADLPKFSGKKLQITSADGKYSIRFGGRIMLDASGGDAEMQMNHGLEFRRVRMFVSGKVAGDWKYKIQLDFDGDKEGSTDFKDVYIAYTGIKGVEWKAGNFYAPQGLEEMTSSKYITFMERTAMSGMMPSRNIGLQAKYDDKANNFGVALGYFGGTFIAEGDSSKSQDTEGVTGRAYWAPINEKGKTLHLGIAGSARHLQDTDMSVKWSALHNAGSLIDVDVTASDFEGYTSFTPEIAFVWGPFSAQAEYSEFNFTGESGVNDMDYSAGYVLASYFVTGESRPYKKGAFKRVKGKGAVELAARYEFADVSDSYFGNDGADMTAWTLGANYYFNPAVRLMANVVLADVEYNDGSSVDGTAFGSRIQIDF
ncbi:MAG: OprO/OprP family phosphate-selective porin [Parvibaculaceae bacterium]|nr:OprO/OprP family phosphate-selective porin [Parvibaculaceae bacterium]